MTERLDPRHDPTSAGAPTDQVARDAALQARLRYARVVEVGTYLGMALLALAFLAYAFGWVRPMVPLEAMPGLWAHPVADYLQRAGLPTGWGWLHFLNHGDVATLIGISVLAAVSLAALLAVLPLYLKRRDWIYVGFTGAGALVLIAAASSWIGS